MAQHSTLSYNQYNENVSRKALGRNMWGVCQAMGIETLTYTNRYAKLADCPKIGDTYEGGIVTTINLKIDSPESYMATIEVSKDFNRLNEYLGIDQRYRQWAIPKEGVNKELFWDEYCKITDELLGSQPTALDKHFRTNFKLVFQGTPQADTQCCVCTITAAQGTSALPLNAEAFGNSLKFSAKTADNYSAGKRAVIANNRKEYQETPYASDVGELSQCRIKLLKALPSGYSSDALPACPEYTGDYPLLNALYVLTKDSSEQINFTAQVHVVSEIPALIVGELLTENNPLIKPMATRAFKIWSLSKKISKFTQTITTAQGTLLDTVGSIATVDYVSYVRFRLEVSGLSTATIGWAITDENGRLYFAENDVGKIVGGVRTLQFSFSHVR